jgi:hypothetical protein
MHQPDAVTIGSTSDSKYKPHPDGTFPAVCVDVVDLGRRVNAFEGKVKISPKIALVFRTGERREDGEYFDVAAEFTASMFDRATLRHFLESWRGKAYTEDQVADGVPISKLCGQSALISVMHATSKQGRTYAKIATVMKLPKGMAVPEVGDYSRPDYWQERKAQYLAELIKHETANAPPPAVKAAPDFGDMPESLADDSDDLPF